MGFRFRRPRVTMLVSVGGELVAGESYRLPAEEADRLILRGYAVGALSRSYDPAETSAARSDSQVVTL